MTAPQTSIYNAAWKAIYRLLDEADFPVADAVDYTPVKVYRTVSTVETKTVPLERIIVHQFAQPPAQLDWAELGAQGRNEHLSIPIRVDTELRARTQEQAGDRLEQLTQTIEASLWAACQLQAFPSETMQYGTQRLLWWTVAQITPNVYPVTNGGFAAEAEVLVAVNARLRGR